MRLLVNIRRLTAPYPTCKRIEDADGNCFQGVSRSLPERIDGPQFPHARRDGKFSRLQNFHY